MSGNIYSLQLSLVIQWNIVIGIFCLCGSVLSNNTSSASITSVSTTFVKNISTSDRVNSTPNHVKNVDIYHRIRDANIEITYSLGGYQNNNNGETQTNKNMAFLPAMFLICFFILITMRACKWYSEYGKFAERGCSYDVASFVILEQGHRKYSVFEDNDTLTTCNSIDSFTFGIPPKNVHGTITSTSGFGQSLQHRIDAQIYDTVTSYKSYLHQTGVNKVNETQNSENSNIDLQLKSFQGANDSMKRPRSLLPRESNNRSLKLSRGPGQGSIKISKDRFRTVIPALDNYMRLKRGKENSPRTSPSFVKFGGPRRVSRFEVQTLRLEDSSSDSPVDADTTLSSVATTPERPVHVHVPRVSYNPIVERISQDSSRPRTVSLNIGTQPEPTSIIVRKPRSESESLGCSFNSTTSNDNVNQTYKYQNRQAIKQNGQVATADFASQTYSWLFKHRRLRKELKPSVVQAQEHSYGTNDTTYSNSSDRKWHRRKAIPKKHRSDALVDNIHGSYEAVQNIEKEELQSHCATARDQLFKVNGVLLPKAEVISVKVDVHSNGDAGNIHSYSGDEGLFQDNSGKVDTDNAIIKSTDDLWEEPVEMFDTSHVQDKTSDLPNELPLKYKHSACRDTNGNMEHVCHVCDSVQSFETKPLNSNGTSEKCPRVTENVEGIHNISDSVTLKIASYIPIKYGAFSKTGATSSSPCEHTDTSISNIERPSSYLSDSSSTVCCSDDCETVPLKRPKRASSGDSNHSYSNVMETDKRSSYQGVFKGRCDEEAVGDIDDNDDDDDAKCQLLHSKSDSTRSSSISSFLSSFSSTDLSRNSDDTCYVAE